VAEIRTEFYFITLTGMRLNPLDTTATTDLLYQAQIVAFGDCGAIGGMKIGKETDIPGEKLP
jgi:hypothetical protein